MMSGFLSSDLCCSAHIIFNYWQEKKSNSREALKEMNERSRVVIAVMAVALIAALLLSINLYGRLKKTNMQLINIYWENGRQARESGDALIGLHFMAKAVDGSNNKNIATAIYQDADDMMPQYRAGVLCMHNGIVKSAIFSKDETRVLSWSNDYTARLWDAATGKQIGPSLTHEDYVNGAEFSRDEKRILTFSNDKTARL